MKRALELAARARGRTSPNPLVGAVIVKEDRVLGEGFHEAAGQPHAEIVALRNAACDVQGATLYVNLEPCSHFGRTPPCADALVNAGLGAVVAAMSDPNPLVSGRGFAILREAGIRVSVGVLEVQAQRLNEVFTTFISLKRPFVLMKAAMTLDGKIASVTGDSRWVSCERSRRLSHEIRDRSRAIMVGSQTVLKDNPSLTTRLDESRGQDPIRIVVDSAGSIPLDCRVIRSDSREGVILATTSRIDPVKEKALVDRGVRVLKLDGSDGRVDLRALMGELFKLEIDSVLLEGGGTLNASFLAAGLVDKVMVFVAPKIIGGREAATPVAGEGIRLMDQAVRLKNLSVTRSGEDVLIQGYVDRPGVENK